MGRERGITTNLDYIIASLKGEIDDDGASREAVIYYNIACPHIGERAKCDDYPFDIPRNVCVECKEEWLAKECDE